METAIIAGLVAALVSALGLLVNLRIARDSRRANELQLRLQAALKDKEEAIKEIKLYTETVEGFRSACWQVMAQLMLQERQNPDEISDIDRKVSDNAFQTFEAQAKIFFDSWAKIKADVSHLEEPSVTYARALRHECKNMAADISVFLRSKKHELGNAQFPEADRKNLKAKTTLLLHRLDDLFTVVNDMRNRIITEVMVG